MERKDEEERFLLQVDILVLLKRLKDLCGDEPDVSAQIGRVINSLETINFV